MPDFAPTGLPRSIAAPLDGPSNPAVFVLPQGVAFDLQAVYAEIDASGAGDTTATLTVTDSSGVVIAKKRQGEAVTGGATGSATWALRLDDEQPASPPASVMVLYGAEGSGAATSDLYVVDLPAATATSVGPIGFALTGLAFDPTTRNLYGVTNNASGASPRSLVLVDRATGAGTLIGPLGLSGGENASDICCSPGGQLYGIGTGPGRWFSINKATGAATVIAPTAYNGGGADFVGNTVYRARATSVPVEKIDPTTGNETILAAPTAPGHVGANMTALAYNPACREMIVPWNNVNFVSLLNLATLRAGDVSTIVPALDAIAWAAL